MRKKLAAAAAAFSLVSLAACSSDEAGQGSGGMEGTTVISYNTPEQWANWGGVLEEFTASTSIEAPNDPKNSGQTLAALEAEKDAPAADVAYYGIVFGYEAVDKDLVQPYKPEGFDDVPDALKDPDGNWVALHQGAIAMLVNTDELDGAPVPECWSDLTQPEYEGKVAYLDPTQAAVGYSVLTAANLSQGGTLDDPSKGIEWAKSMKENGVSNPVQTATAQLQAGEIPILIDADFNGYKLKADGAPIEVVYPCEGTIGIPYTMSLVKGAPHEEQGKALLDFALSDEGQKLFAEAYLKPVRKVEMPAEVKEVFPSDEEYEKLVASPDFKKMKDVQEQTLEEYKAQVQN